ncbi:hypothetical protein PMAYCL1PPCAC_04695, partial [Pristionchus mayeri]
YFYCVFYRRCVVLPPGSSFCYVGWRRVTLFAGLQALMWCLGCAVVIIVNGTRTPAEEIPAMLDWVRATQSFIVIRVNLYFWIGGVC